MFLELSYKIDEHNPGNVLGISSPQIIWRAKFGDGQSKANQTSSLKVFNHYGTHIDTPLHLFPDGKVVADYDISDFVFERVVLLNCRKEDFEKIERNDLEPSQSILEQAELLLIYTGFSEYRFTDTERYVKHAPGFSEEGAQYIVDHFPTIRCIGIDFMSIENIPAGREVAWPVHKIFLGSQANFLLIEGMNLAPVAGKTVTRVIVAPLRINAEASPATVIAEIA